MLKHLLDFTLFHNLCRHLGCPPGAAWSVIAMYEKPVLCHTTGLEVAGYAAHQQRTAEYATMFTLIGHGHHLSGYQYPVIVSYGSHDWNATIHDDGTVILELRRISFEDAAQIVESLQ